MRGVHVHQLRHHDEQERRRRHDVRPVRRVTQRFQCSHVRAGQNAATVTCAMKAIEGAPTRAVDLDTETELCTLCSARMVSALVQLEKDGGVAARAPTVVRP
jgi:hypothetical protein